MSWVEDRYYKTNRTLLKAFGLWPYHRTKWMHFRATIILSLYLSFIFVQFAVFVTHEMTIDLATNVLSAALDSVFMTLMYCMYYFNADSFKELTQRMYQHWESLSDNVEFTIMDSHARLTQLFMHMFSGFVIFIELITIMSYAIPITLDIVAPINVTRGETVYITSEYFVDHSKYYILIVIHLTTSVCIGAISMLSTSIMLLGIGFHACALFKVANYRMGIVMDETVLQMSISKREQMIHERIIHAVNFHRTAMEFVYIKQFPRKIAFLTLCSLLFNSRFCQLILIHVEKLFGVLVVIGVMSTSIILFRLLNAIKYHIDDFIEVFITIAILCVHFVYLFFGNHIGQLITDNNSEIFDTAYNLPWYVASPNMKQLLLFVLQRGHKKFYLSLSTLFNASYEGFATLTTSSISYFTVLYSM